MTTMSYLTRGPRNPGCPIVVKAYETNTTKRNHA